jgi:hypothetical protein
MRQRLVDLPDHAWKGEQPKWLIHFKKEQAQQAKA